ncbi:MAG: AAA family ATPase [Elusimicrobia bacterium]|nr:AAA family ATPase [Elusimicrobiota bacterium]MBD3411542.1 AAA family ATPase [Elusimicrobiota bacterium]
MSNRKKQFMIGLTGLNGSGKGVVADYLVSRKGFTYYSLSDAVREEVVKHHQDITRERLIETANNLRRMHGPAVLAQRILEKINKSLDDMVIDSFRNPEEVRAFKAIPGFTLWCIHANQALRFERIKKRHREQDPQVFEEFVRIENAELSSNDVNRQNLMACIRLADQTIANEGSRAELYQEIDSQF